METSQSKLLLSAAIAGILGIAGPAAAAEKKAAEKMAKEDPAKAETVECCGVNQCKHQTDCATATNACKSENACKGQGYKNLSRAECEKKHGTVGPCDQTKSAKQKKS